MFHCRIKFFGNGDRIIFSVGTIPFLTFVCGSDNWSINRGLKIRPLIRTTLARASCCHGWSPAHHPRVIRGRDPSLWSLRLHCRMTDATWCPTPPIHQHNASDFLKSSLRLMEIHFPCSTSSKQCVNLIEADVNSLHLKIFRIKSSGIHEPER